MGNNCSKDAWRKPHPRLAWTPEFITTLVKEIQETSQRSSLRPCLLLIGPLGDGKSSLVNTFLSAGGDDIVQKADTGSDPTRLTLKFTRYDGVGDLRNKYRVCDTMGIIGAVESGIRSYDIVQMIRGHIGPGYKFRDDKDISEEDPKYVRDPTDQDKSHCLVIVLDSAKVTELACCSREKIRVAIRAAREEGIPTAIVLTKIDSICVHVSKDKKNIFTCKHTQDVVTRTSEVFGLPESRIFPVINYAWQVSKSEAAPIDTIALLALQKLLQISYDYQ